MKTLHLHIKKKYWDRVKNGIKIEEYRLHNIYWSKRLIGKDYGEIQYHLGYPKKGDRSRTLKFGWNGYDEDFITHELFNNKKEFCFIISLSSRNFKV